MRSTFSHSLHKYSSTVYCAPVPCEQLWTQQRTRQNPCVRPESLKREEQAQGPSEKETPGVCIHVKTHQTVYFVFLCSVYKFSAKNMATF